MNAKFSLILLLSAFAVARAEIHRGYGTAYSGPYDMDATGQNMCEYNPKSLPDRWQVYYGAMNEADWNAAGGLGKGGICGRCIRVNGVKGETTKGFVIKDVYVKIVDQCPDWACDRGNVDFSTTALKAITGYGWDKKLIEWEYVTCPDDTEAIEEAAADAQEEAEDAQDAAEDATREFNTAQDKAEAAADNFDEATETAESGAALAAAAKAEALAEAKLEAKAAARTKAIAKYKAAVQRANALVRRTKGRKMM